MKGPGRSHIGPARNPIDENRHKGFIQLDHGRGDIEGSRARLFDGSSGSQNQAIAYPSRVAEGQQAFDVERDIPLNQIHVRDEVQVGKTERFHGRDTWENIV